MYRRPGGERGSRTWLIGYLALVLVVSRIGSTDFGGTGAIPAPWDTVVVAVIGLAAWAVGVRSGLLHLAAHPAPEPQEADPGETSVTRDRSR